MFNPQNILGRNLFSALNISAVFALLSCQNRQNVQHAKHFLPKSVQQRKHHSRKKTRVLSKKTGKLFDVSGKMTIFAAASGEKFRANDALAFISHFTEVA